MAITPNAQSPAMEAANAEPRSGSLADVLDVILDKGIVIDAFVRVSLVGIEILTLDARIVVASVDTYMHFAREAHRMEMGGGQGSAKQGLAGMMGNLAEGGAHNITRGALQGAGEGLRKGLLPPRREPEERHGVVQRAVGALRDALAPKDEDDQDRGQAPDQDSREGAPPSARSGQQGRTSAGGSQRTRRQSSSGGSTPEGGQESGGGGSSRRPAPTSRRPPSRGRQA